jgi:hypothetical protein
LNVISRNPVSFTETFPELISGRGFDRYQAGLNARFLAKRIDYRLTYGEPTAKPLMFMDYDTPSAVGRVTLWESGECDMEVLDAETGEDLLREHHEFSDAEAFFSTYPKVPNLVYAHSNGSRIGDE